MEVCDLPERDQEVVKLIIEDHLKHNLGLTAEVRWLYSEEQQSLMVLLENQAVLDTLLRDFPRVQVDDNVSYKVRSYKPALPADAKIDAKSTQPQQPPAHSPTGQPAQTATKIPRREAGCNVEVLNVSDEVLVLCFFENLVQHNLSSTYDANRKLMVITFDESAEAEKVLQQTTYQVDDHADVTVRKPPKVTRAISITGIPASTTEAQLRMYFKGPLASGGTIKSISLESVDGSARIVFEEESVARAVASKHEHIFNRACLSVRLAEEEPARGDQALPEITTATAAATAALLYATPDVNALKSSCSSPTSSALIVRNLPADMSADQLRRQIVSSWGSDASTCGLNYNPSTGAAVICFSSDAGLQRALATKLGKDMITEACQTDQLSAVLGDIDLLVDGISSETSTEALWCWLRVVVGRFPHRIICSRSHVKAIGQFAYSEAIDIVKISEAVSDSKHMIDRKRLHVKPVRRTANLLVTNLKDSITDAMLRKYFENTKIHGIKDTSVDVRLVETGSAVVSFDKREAVEMLLQQQHELTLGDQKLCLSQCYEELGVAGPYELHDFTRTVEALTAAAGSSFAIDPKLIVRGFEGKIPVDILKKFLENRKLSSGGKIKAFVPADDVVMVTFEDAEAVERVCQKYMAEGLKVGECSLTACSKPTVNPQHVARNKVLLRNVGEASEDSIKYFLWGLTGTPVKHLSFVREPPDPSMCVIASFSRDVDIEHVISSIRTLTLDSSQVDAEPVGECSTLVVTGAPLDVHKDVLELAFPCDIDHCYQQSPGVWLITPSDLGCVDRILQEPVMYNGKELAVSVHSPFKAVENAREPGKRGQLQAEFPWVPPAVVDFVLAKRKTVLDALLEETGCSIDISKQGVLTVAHSRPIPSAHYLSVLEYWHGVQQRLQAFFGEYVLDPVQVIPGIWNAVLKSEAFNKAVNSRADDLTVLKPEPEAGATAGTLLLIGCREAVQQAREHFELVVREINDEMERERQITHVTEAGLTDWGIGLLKASGFFAELSKRSNKVTFELDEGEHQIRLRGLPKDIQSCQTSIKNTLSGSVEHVLEWSTAATELVKKENVKQLIDGKLSASGLSKSCVWWIGQDARVFVRGLTDECTRKATALIGQYVVENQILLEPEAVHLLDSDKWNTVRGTMCASRGGNAVIIARKMPFVLLAASLQPDANSLLEELQSFLHQNVVKKQFLRMSAVIMKLLSGSMKADVAKLEQSEARNDVKLEARLGSGEMGFHIRGTADGCINIQRKIRDLIKNEKVVTRELTIRFPGAEAALSGSGSAVLLEVSCSSGTHIQLYDEDAVKEPETVSGAAGPSTSHSLEHDAVTLPGGTMLCIVKADITELDCDVIVNPSNQHLNHAGGLAKVIADKAGPDLNKECRAHMEVVKGCLKEGDACITGAGRLRCKRVVHAVGPVWQGGTRSESSKLYMAVMQSLRLAAAETSCTSIAIPPISSGIFGYPLDKSTQTIVDSVVDHCEEPGGTRLKRIIFVDINDGGVASFHRALGRKLGRVAVSDDRRTINAGNRMNTVGEGNTISSSKGSLQKLEMPVRGVDPYRKPVPKADIVRDAMLAINDLHIELLRADLFNLQVDSLVCTVTGDLDLSKGMLSGMLSKHAGPGLQQQLKSDNPSPIKEGDIVATAGHQLPSCNLVLLVCCPRCQPSTQSKVIKDLVLGCLDRADKQKVKSIAFPAIGTGNLGFPAEEVASNMFDALFEFSKQKNRSISRVKVVLAKDEWMPIFYGELQKSPSKHSAASLASGHAAGSLGSLAPRTTNLLTQPASSSAALTGRQLCFHLLEEGVNTTTASKEPRESSVDLVDDDEFLSDKDDSTYSSAAFALRLSITGPEAKIPLAVDMLVDQCQSRLVTHIINDPAEMIMAMTSNQMLRLTRKGIRCDVQVEVNEGKHSTQIKLSSMNSHALLSMRAYVSELLLRGHTTRLQEEMASAKAQWQYKPAGANDWLNYPRSVNAMLETASQGRQPALKYGPPGMCYTVDLIKNLDCSDAQPDDVVHVRRWNMRLSFPSEWSQEEGYVEVLLDPGSSEYLDVVKEFKSTLTDTTVNVLEVKRVQNPQLYQQYQMFKERVKADLSPGCRLEVERKLWHGTAEDMLPSICRKGFNRRYCNAHAVVYGQGVYFSRDAKYSTGIAHSVPNAAKEQHMIYCITLTGEYEVGSSAMTYTNIKPGQPMAHFDTTVDQIPDPSIFVTYHDDQVYPAYTVKFKLG